MPTLNDTGKRRGTFMRAGAVLVCTAISFIICTGTASAAGTALLEAMRQYEIDATTNLYSDGFRMLGFGILKGLGKLSDSLYSSLTYIFESIDITYSSQVGALIRKYRIIYKLIFTISVAAFGLYLVARTNTGQMNTLNCLMLIFLVLAAMPLMTERLAKLTEAGSGYVQSRWAAEADDMKVESLSGTIMKDYIIDLEKVDRNIASDNPGRLKEAINDNSGYNDFENGGKAWRYIDINEPMNYNDNSYKKSFWDKKLEEYGGRKQLVDMSASWLDKFDIYYYRYQMTSWLSPILMLLVLCVVFLFSGFRCATMIIEIIQAEIYMPFVAVTDLASGQRIKEGLKHFLTLFAGIFLCVALLGIYFICYNWINVNIDNIMAQIVFQLALAWAVLNGPNAIERILGVDVGVKDGWKILLGLNAAKATGAAGIAAVAAVGNAISKPARVVVGAMRERSGKEAHEAMEQEKSAAGQYEERSTKEKGEADKKAAEGQRKTDPMAQNQNSAFENAGFMSEQADTDPMTQLSNDEVQNTDSTVQTSDEKVQNADPMSEQGEKASDPMSVKGDSQNRQENSEPVSGAQSISGDMTEQSGTNADPMSSRAQQHRITPPLHDSGNNVQEPSTMQNAAIRPHDHMETAPQGKNVPEPKPVIIDGKSVDLKKGEI